MPALRSPHDREIARLALPALGTLAAEPTYLLVDTAMVGHLGAEPLASLALAISVLTVLAGLAIVLTYATTAAVARLAGAGERDDVQALAAQSLWLGGVAGVGATLVAVLAGPAWIDLLGGRGEVADDAVAYLRIVAPGLGFAILGLAAQGWSRGTGDLRTPLLIVVAGNAINVVLNPVLIRGAGLGLHGSALATLTGQTVMGLCFVALLLRASRGRSRRPRPALLRRLGATGGLLLVRTAALQLTFAVAAGVAAHLGTASLGAHQVGWQLFSFVALVLDAIAIASQVLVGRALGASRPDEATEAARRMVVLTVAGGTALALALFVLRDPVLGAFTSSGDVRGRAAEMWPFFCLLFPFGAAVFAFDGILIGAGDARFLAAATVAAGIVGVAAMLALRAAGTGVAGVWIGIDAVMAARLAGTWWRFRSARWATEGAWRG